MDVYRRVLEVLSQHPEGVPQSTLYKVLSVSKSYISRVIKDLERLGLVYRVRVGNTYIVKVSRPATRVFTGRRLALGVVWSSEYLFLGHFAKLLRDRLSIDLEVKVYPSALRATLAIVLGEVDSVLSPLVTQLYAYAISKSFKIVGGGAYGGAAIYEIIHAKEDTVISSEMSTMDLCRSLAMDKGVIEATNVEYFNSPEEAINNVKMGRARYAVVWHPLTQSIESLGKRVAECTDFEEIRYCCTFAVSNTVSEDYIEKIAEIYRESIEKFQREPTRFV